MIVQTAQIKSLVLKTGWDRGSNPRPIYLNPPQAGLGLKEFLLIFLNSKHPTSWIRANGPNNLKRKWATLVGHYSWGQTFLLFKYFSCDAIFKPP